MEEKLVDSLKNLISGKVTAEKEFLDFYSLDSSAYSKRPRLIVFPKSTDDVKKTIIFAKKRKIPICARGGSTGLVGSSLTTGIILDMKNFNKIKLSKNHVTVGAGVSKGELDLILKHNKKFLGPNPSVGAFCKIGGMIANNSSGARSLKYGSIIDNLLEVVLVDGNGNENILSKNKTISKKITKNF
jgi:FAD/FMN-containing dehydrogenases